MLTAAPRRLLGGVILLVCLIVRAWQPPRREVVKLSIGKIAENVRPRPNVPRTLQKFRGYAHRGDGCELAACGNWKDARGAIMQPQVLRNRSC